MINQHYRYTPLIVDVVTLAPFETFTFNSFNAGSCKGTIYVYGCILPIGDTSWQPIVEHREWRDRSVWGGWASQETTEGAATFRASPRGAQWVCLSLYKDVERNFIDREVEHHAIDGTFTVPAGWGVVVAWVKPVPIPGGEDDEAIEYEPGHILIGDQQAATGNYVKPRDDDYAVIGTADLLLVR
jgi:hypothetical protein